MKHELDQPKLEKLARQELDHSIDKLDESTLARLRVARKKAVDLTTNSPSTSYTGHLPALISRGWLPVGGIAATAAAVILTVSLSVTAPTLMDVTNLEDIAVLSATENLDLFDELEFYEWLEDEKHSNS